MGDNNDTGEVVQQDAIELILHLGSLLADKHYVWDSKNKKDL